MNFFQTNEQRLASILGVFTKAKEDIEAHLSKIGYEIDKQKQVIADEAETLAALVIHSDKAAAIAAKFKAFLEV